MSQPHSSGADESQYYIMRLALAQGTSDGNRSPLPSFRVTHRIWQTRNILRQYDFHQKKWRVLFIENTASLNGCGT